jgi:hypothetical protein
VSTLSPAAVASRVGTVDDDFRISRVIETEVTRRFCAGDFASLSTESEVLDAVRRELGASAFICHSISRFC